MGVISNNVAYCAKVFLVSVAAIFSQGTCLSATSVVTTCIFQVDGSFLDLVDYPTLS